MDAQKSFTLKTRFDHLLARLRRPLQGQQGFTLIEAMILATILSITVVTFSTYSLQRARLIKSVDQSRKNAQVSTSIQNSGSQAESMARSEELQYDSTLPDPSPSPF